MKTRLALWIVLPLAILSLIPVHSAIDETDTDGYLLVDDHGQHQIRIESYSWYFIAYDLVSVDHLVAQGLSVADAMHQSSYKDSIGKFRKNTVVNLTAQSHDIQHGFAITEFGIQLTLDRALPGEEWGPLAQASFTTPNEDVSYTAFCHIYCGIGHPYEKIRLTIGEDTANSGTIIYDLMVYLNIAILILFAGQIWKSDKPRR